MCQCTAKDSGVPTIVRAAKRRTPSAMVNAGKKETAMKTENGPSGDEDVSACSYPVEEEPLPKVGFLNHAPCFCAGVKPKRRAERNIEMETKFKQIPRFHIREGENLWPDYTLTLEDVSKLSVDDVKELFRAFSLNGTYWFGDALRSLRPDPFGACDFADAAKVYDAYRVSRAGASDGAAMSRVPFQFNCHRRKGLL